MNRNYSFFIFLFFHSCYAPDIYSPTGLAGQHGCVRQLTIQTPTAATPLLAQQRPRPAAARRQSVALQQRHDAEAPLWFCNCESLRMIGACSLPKCVFCVCCYLMQQIIRRYE